MLYNLHLVLMTNTTAFQITDLNNSTQFEQLLIQGYVHFKHVK